MDILLQKPHGKTPKQPGKRYGGGYQQSLLSETRRKNDRVANKGLHALQEHTRAKPSAFSRLTFKNIHSKLAPSVNMPQPGQGSPEPEPVRASPGTRRILVVRRDPDYDGPSPPSLGGRCSQ